MKRKETIEIDEFIEKKFKEYKKIVCEYLLDKDWEQWEDCQTKSNERWIIEALNDAIRFMETIKKPANE